MSGLKGSSSTVGASSATLARGEEILNQIAMFGVVKTEPDDEDAKILAQIEARGFRRELVIQQSWDIEHLQALQKSIDDIKARQAASWHICGIMVTVLLGPLGAACREDFANNQGKPCQTRHQGQALR